MTGSESHWALPISNLRFAPHGSQGSLLDCLHPELTGTAGSFLGGGNSPQATGDREEIWSLTCTKSKLLLSNYQLPEMGEASESCFLFRI